MPIRLPPKTIIRGIGPFDLHVILSVLVRDIVDDSAPAVVTKIDIDVRRPGAVGLHMHPFGVVEYRLRLGSCRT
jgi:hypothetical protein